LSLKGTIGIHGQDRAKGALSYATQLFSTNQLIPAPRCFAQQLALARIHPDLSCGGMDTPSVLYRRQFGRLGQSGRGK